MCRWSIGIALRYQHVFVAQLVERSVEAREVVGAVPTGHTLGPIVYRLGHLAFNQTSGVRFSVGSPSLAVGAVVARVALDHETNVRFIHSLPMNKTKCDLCDNVAAQHLKLDGSAHFYRCMQHGLPNMHKYEVRDWTPPAIHFKGRGLYSTDNKRA